MSTHEWSANAAAVSAVSERSDVILSPRWCVSPDELSVMEMSVIAGDMDAVSKIKGFLQALAITLKYILRTVQGNCSTSVQPER